MRRYVYLAIILSLAIVLGIIESFIPQFIPGFRLGLANIATLIVLYLYGKKDALILSMLRVLLVSILIGRFLSITFYMSLGGAIFAYIIMIIMKQLNFNIITVSISGAIFHVFGQIIAGSIVLSNALMFTYMPILLVLSLVTGALNGFISSRVINIVKKVENK